DGELVRAQARAILRSALILDAPNCRCSRQGTAPLRPEAGRKGVAARAIRGFPGCPGARVASQRTASPERRPPGADERLRLTARAGRKAGRSVSPALDSRLPSFQCPTQAGARRTGRGESPALRDGLLPTSCPTSGEH